MNIIRKSQIQNYCVIMGGLALNLIVLAVMEKDQFHPLNGLCQEDDD